MGVVNTWVVYNHQQQFKNHQSTVQCVKAMAADRVEAGVVQQTQIGVKTTGNPISISNSPHARTNHYIRESRPYITNRILNTYWTFCDINIMVAFAIWLVISLILTFLYWVLATVNLIINVLWLCIFIQHMTVVHDTIPYVLKQPIVPNNSLRLANDFIEIEVHQVKGAYAVSQNAGIGILRRNQGKIKFHVLSEGAASKIRTSKTLSIIGLLCSILMVIISNVMIPVGIAFITYGS